jgi:hypothetical protein
MQRGPACITTQSSGTTPSETKHSGLSHKPPREERPRTRMCMHRRLHAGNLTSPPLPFSPLPHARLHAGSSSRRVCLAYAVPLIRTKKASPKKERDTQPGYCSDVGAASKSVVHVCLAYAVLYDRESWPNEGERKRGILRMSARWWGERYSA